jgi:predicted dehydrogenase
VKLVVIATRHDTHEVLATEALSAGKHVFCEKPLAITRDGLERVASAWRANSGCLMVGFNRRYAPAVRSLRRHFGSTDGPLVVTYRVNAGSLPDTHWYLDRRQGGRLIGEVCHFIDTCSFIVGEKIASVTCVGSGRGEALLQQDVVVTLRYADGSLATISYASGGHPSTPKERIEVLGRGRSGLIDDFRTMLLDGKARKVTTRDKGHAAELALLRRMLVAGDGGQQVTVLALETMSATLAAAESLISGVPVVPPQG